MLHPDEGTIHAWLDGALAPEEARRFEDHVASCATCGEAVAEARGLVASSSRILGALDTLPGDVVPRALEPVGGQRAGGQGAARRARWWTRPLIPAAAAALLVVAVSYGVLVRPSERAMLAGRAAAVDPSTSPRAENMQESAASQFDSAPSTEVDEAIAAASTARAPQAAVTDTRPTTSAERDTRGAAEAAAVVRAVPPPAPAPAELRSYAEDTEAGVRARTPADQALAKTDAVRADIPRAPVAPDTNRLRIAELAVPARVQPQAHGAPDTNQLGRAAPPMPAPTPSPAMGLAQALTDDTARVQLVVISQRSDTNLIGVVHTTVYVVRPGIHVTHQAIERRYQPTRRERAGADTSAEDDAAGERTLLTLDMSRVQAVHWTDAAGVYHTLSGPVEQEELARIRVALRERAPEP